MVGGVIQVQVPLIPFLAKAEYFLTTDKALLRKMANHDNLHVVDPVDFIRVLEETTNED